MIVSSLRNINAYVKSMGQQLKIKTEFDVQQSLGIKQEINEDSDEHQIEDVINANDLTVAHEKQKLLEAFGLLKAENQKLTFELKEKQLSIYNCQAIFIYIISILKQYF